MTKSTITRERLEQLAKFKGAAVTRQEEQELARIALDAMDSDPVAYMTYKGYLLHAGDPKLAEYSEPTPLYAAPQPAPVVLKDHQIRELVNQLRDIAIEYHGTQQLRERIARVLRAAMLQAEPVCTCPSGDGSLRWPCPVHPGNSLVIPDGYVMVPKEPTAEMQSAGASAIRIETTALNKLWTGNAVFRAMLAAAPQEVKGE